MTEQEKMISQLCFELNVAIKNAPNDVLIEIIKDGRTIPTHHHYSDIFLLENLAIEELKNRGIDPVTFESRRNRNG